VAIAVMAVHILIDVLKIYRQRTHTLARWFMIDQLLHNLSILLIWGFFYRPDLPLDLFLVNNAFWIYLTAILFLTVVCGIVIQILLGSWTKSIEPLKEKSLPNAGKYIGILERLLVFIFVVTGHWEAIGFLVAAKSVFRFGDLKDSRDRKLTEYILIGTLLSFGIAIMVGIVVLAFTAN
jgi:flagellar biosynthesis protein FlhB